MLAIHFVFEGVLPGDLYDMVSLAEDDAWRRIRNILTPSFTTGRIKEVQITITHFVTYLNYIYPHYLSLTFVFGFFACLRCTRS